MFRKISTAALLCMALSATALVMAQKVAKDLDDAISAASNWVGWKAEDTFTQRRMERRRSRTAKHASIR